MSFKDKYFGLFVKTSLLGFAFLSFFTLNVTTKSRRITRSEGVLKNTVSNLQGARRSLYHGVHPGSASGDESSVTDLPAYEDAVGKNVTFVYFSQELDKKWLKCRRDCPPLFPSDQLEALKKRDPSPVPFIRLMTRTTMDLNKEKNKEDLYTYDLLLNSPELDKSKRELAVIFHDKLLAWGRAAKEYGKPLYVEWGTEANGDWFWWNAKWYAKERCERGRRPRSQSEQQCLSEQYQEGTRKFRQTFIHLRDIINREAQATNVRWIFHVNESSSPAPNLANQHDAWNSIENYYPGRNCEGCVDIVGLSIYGAQSAGDQCSDPTYSFSNKINGVLTGEGRAVKDSLKDIGREKKVFILEFGQTLFAGGGSQPNSNCNAGKWGGEALAALFDASRWPNIKIAGFSWWNEAWVDDEGVTDMRVNTFDFCAGLSRDDIRKVYANGMDCCCWLENNQKCNDATEQAKCHGLRLNRATLRQALADALNEHKMYLREKPDGL